MADGLGLSPRFLIIVAVLAAACGRSTPCDLTATRSGVSVELASRCSIERVDSVSLLRGSSRSDVTSHFRVIGGRAVAESAELQNLVSSETRPPQFEVRGLANGAPFFARLAAGPLNCPRSSAAPVSIVFRASKSDFTIRALSKIRRTGDVLPRSYRGGNVATVTTLDAHGQPVFITQADASFGLRVHDSMNPHSSRIIPREDAVFMATVPGDANCLRVDVPSVGTTTFDVSALQSDLNVRSDERTEEYP